MREIRSVGSSNLRQSNKCKTDDKDMHEAICQAKTIAWKYQVDKGIFVYVRRVELIYWNDPNS